jgi:hypothetical protein
MTRKITPIAALLPLFLAFAGGPTQAQAAEPAQAAAIDEENAEQRLNLSGKLRMLSQRIPSAACHLSLDIDTEGATALLSGAAAEFEKILTALEFGDAELNIMRPETRRKTLFRIAELRAEWEPMQAAAQAMMAGTATDDDLAFILSHNLAVLTRAQLLVEEVSKQYANPNAMTRAAAALIDISGRQRMLTQRMSKESCMAATTFATPQTTVSLNGTMSIFEASLEALRFGMPAVGIAPPPNAAISDGLAIVLDDWTSVKPHVTAVIAGETLDPAASVAKFQGLNVTMVNMNKVVGMYAAAASPR